MIMSKSILTLHYWLCLLNLITMSFMKFIDSAIKFAKSFFKFSSFHKIVDLLQLHTMSPINMRFMFTVNLLSSLKSTDITLFIRDETSSYPFAIDVPNNITAAELYDKVPGINIGDALSVGGIEIVKSDTSHIAELSICSETVIQLIHRPPTDALSLYHFAKDLKNRELINWWSFALRCYQWPQSRMCHQQMVCRWPDIECNRQNQTTFVALDSYQSDESMSIRSPLMDIVDLCHLNKEWKDTLFISGKLVLRYLPQTVVILVASGAGSGARPKFDEVDFRGLESHHLRSIDLTQNEIKSIEFNDLKGTSVENLDLAYNQISSINLQAINGTKLKVLYLDDNKIQNVSFHGLNLTKLERLDLQGNDLRVVKCEGMEGSRLKQLHLVRNPIEMIDFQGIRDSSLKYIFMAPDGRKFVAKNLEELRDSSLNEVNIKQIMSYIAE